MKRSVGLWSLMGFAVTSLGGTLLHYLYDWTGSVWIAPFSGVNESTWEHMKLFFWPMFLFAILQSFIFRDYRYRYLYPNFWPTQLKGIWLGLGLIPVLFYTYNGAIGRSPDFVNIAIFFVAAAVAYLFIARRLTPTAPTDVTDITDMSASLRAARISRAALVGTALLFLVFTFAPPEIGLFKDPLTGTFGR